MSPAVLRRYRAERLLERDFRALRGAVLASVAARLRAAGSPLDRAELEACYAAAWQGLYGAALAGEEVANPRAWLIVVTYRRAIDELRSTRVAEPLPAGAGVERDLDEQLDDRDRVRALLQGMRARLDLREREAAALCYLHGYSRGEAAQRMGVSETRMRKLMEGNKGRAGVSAKVGELVEAIREGRFCEQQASLMRALAFGVLDPGGERYRLAVEHRRSCPACRSYVRALRGAAVVLPPVLTVPGGAAGVPLGLLGVGHAAGRAAPLPSLGSAATGGGAGAGGSWAAGGLGAKLAAGCVIAAGVGAGCLAIGTHGSGAPHARRGAPRAALRTPAPRHAAVAAVASPFRPSGAHASTHLVSRQRAPARRAEPGAGGSREFGPEQPAAAAGQRPAAPIATAAQAGGGRPQPSPPGANPAAREFSPV